MKGGVGRQRGTKVREAGERVTRGSEKKHCENADVGRNILLRFRLYEDFWKRSSEFKALVQNAALIYFRPHYLRQIWAWPQYRLTFAGSPLPLFKRHRPQWR